MVNYQQSTVSTVGQMVFIIFTPRSSKRLWATLWLAENDRGRTIGRSMSLFGSWNSAKMDVKITYIGISSIMLSLLGMDSIKMTSVMTVILNPYP